MGLEESKFQADGVMPVYMYQCMDCGELDQRVAGLDDQTAICVRCGSMMLRLDEDVFQPYFDNQERLTDADPRAEKGESRGEKSYGRDAHGKPVLLRPETPRPAGARPATPPAVFHKF
jgi:hypothetical protein